MTAATLIQIESIKALRRRAFYMALTIFIGLLAVIFGGSVYMHRAQGGRPFALPGAWEPIIGEMAMFGLLFASVLLIMLVTSEFVWRTARQNVIDGLSREQWFLGKLILIPALALIFFLLQVGLGGAIAALDTDFGAVESVVGSLDATMMGAYLLALLGYLSLAFLFAIILRSPGPAMGLFFLYMVLVEPLVRGGIARLDGRFETIADYLPVNMLTELLQRANWSTELQSALAWRAAQAGRPVPEFIDPAAAVPLAVGYVLLFAGVAYVVYRRRDL